MKKVYLSVFGIITVLALIIAFENIMSYAAILIFFTQINSLFAALLFMFLLGAIAGFFFGLAQGVKKEDNSSLAGTDFDL